MTRRSRYSTSQRPNKYEPSSKKGNLYYVRLKTSVGMLYKIGFTAMGSAQERLGFDGSGTELMIDKELMFLPFDNAWDLEQELHKVFKNRAAFCGWHEGMPLYGKGQSELYSEDVLDLDHEYKWQQGEDTRDEIAIVGQVGAGINADLVRASYRRKRENSLLRQLSERDTEFNPRKHWLNHPVAWPLKMVGKLIFFAVFGLVTMINKLSETGYDKRAAELREMLKWEVRVARRKRIQQLKLNAE